MAPRAHGLSLEEKDHWTRTGHSLVNAPIHRPRIWSVERRALACGVIRRRISPSEGKSEEDRFLCLGVGLVALVLAGCAAAPASYAELDGPAPEPTAGSTTTFTDGLLTYQVTHVEGAFVGHALARLEGTLTFENGCLLVAGHPIIFPGDDTSWDGTTLMANGNEFVPGDMIVLGGGAPLDATLPENTPDQCGGGGVACTGC